MSKPLPVLAVRLESDRSLSFLFHRKDFQTLGLVTSYRTQDDAVSPEGMFVSGSKRTVGQIHDATGTAKAIYVFGDGKAFGYGVTTTFASVWVSQGDIKFGSLPQNAMDVAEMRFAYTGSFAHDDLVLALEGSPSRAHAPP